MTARERHLKKKFGISLEEYDQLLKVQNGRCFICGNEPKTRALNVDHQHTKGYDKLPDVRKRSYIRGLLCFRCNHRFMGRGMNLMIAYRIVEYFRRYYFSGGVWKNLICKTGNIANTVNK